MLDKHELKNGNTFAWLGGQKIRGCENALILAGGDVLLLKEEGRLTGDKIQEDISNLSKEQFFSEYGWENNSSADDLYWELKRWTPKY